MIKMNRGGLLNRLNYLNDLFNLMDLALVLQYRN